MRPEDPLNFHSHRSAASIIRPDIHSAIMDIYRVHKAYEAGFEPAAIAETTVVNGRQWAKKEKPLDHNDPSDFAIITHGMDVLDRAKLLAKLHEESRDGPRRALEALYDD